MIIQVQIYISCVDPFLLRLWLKSFICAEWTEVAGGSVISAPLGSSAPDCSCVNEPGFDSGMWTDLTCTLPSSCWMHCSPPFNNYTAHKSKWLKVILCNKQTVFGPLWMKTPNIGIQVNTDYEIMFSMLRLITDMTVYIIISF